MSFSMRPLGRVRALATAIALSLVGIAVGASPAFADADSDPTADPDATEAPAGEAPAEAETTIVPDGDIFISELHYDNVGEDAGEAIEVQAPAGTDLTGWTLVLYNGNVPSSASTYSSATKLGAVGDSGVIVAEYAANGLQNGPNDGVALVNPDGEVVELLSYEGTFTAGNGPAAGLRSTDIGVREESNAPVGQSLQKINGTWTGPLVATFGTLNGADDPDPEPGVVPIAEIQGTGAESPLVGQTVTTRGVVTAVYATGGFDGYYVQTAGTGGTGARTASDGLFVYSAETVGDVAIGDQLELTGEVSEYNGLTQIKVAAGGALPVEGEFEPVVPIADFVLPATEGEREAYEGMLVEPADRYVVADTYALGGWGNTRYGSIGLGLDGPLVQETEVALPGTAEYDESVADNAARAVTLDDGQSQRTSFDDQVPYLTGNSDVRTGAELTFAAPVIVDYRFQWSFQPTSPVTGDGSAVVEVAGGNTQAANAAPADVGGDVTIAAFNVLNYFTTLGEDLEGCESYNDRDGNPLTVSGGCDARGAWDQASLQRQQDKIVTALNTLDADIVGVQEIENSAAFGEDRDAAVTTLVAALNEAAGEGKWAFAPSPEAVPGDEDVIRTAFIYQPDAVTLDGESQILIDDPAFYNAREPLAQAFTSVANPEYSFLAVNNHFKSKGGDCGDLPEGCFDSDRVAQAQALTKFADEVATEASIEDIFLVGDFNSYTAENPLVALADAGYKNLNPGEPTYTYDGKVGSIDHLFANESAAARITGADVWQTNAAESVLAEYSRWNYFASQHVELGSQYRASDHNPLIAGIDVPDAEPTGPTTIDLLSINDFHGRIEADGESAGAAVLSCAVDSYREANPNTLLVAAGDSIGATTFTSAVANDQPTIDVLNEIGLDASSFGNHEFDQGQDDVNDRVLPAVNWPYLAANIYREDGSYAYDPYAVLETGGVRVGIIGAITEQLPSLVSPAGMEGLEVGDITESVNTVAAALSDGDESNGEADVLVVVIHDGAPSSDLASAEGTPFGDLIQNVDENVSAIVSGHTQTSYVEQVGDVWVTQTGDYGENLGRLQIVVDEAGEASVALAENVDLVTEDGPICDGDPEVQAIVDAAVANAEELGADPVGEISADFLRGAQTDGSENRGAESTIGNFVADAQLWATSESGSQIAFMNPGGIRQDLLYAASGDEGDGVVTYKEAAVVQPFANTLVTMDLTGAQVFEVLEQQWQPDGASRPFLKLGVSTGFRYVYDPDAAAGERIVSATLNGEPVTADAVYQVTANSFLASGGDNFTAFTTGTNQADSGRVDLDSQVEYFQALEGPVSPDPVQRAVGVTWVSDPSAPLTVGDEVAFDLSSLAFTRDEPKPTEVTVTLDGESVGTFAVDSAIVDTTDEAGQASVSVTVPDGLSGDVVLEVSDDVNGVVLTQTVTIEDDTEPEPEPEPENPWERFAKWLWELLKRLFPWWPWP